jgi:hypothetical protein
MKKIKLAVETLKVESFRPAEPVEARLGTVRGNQSGPGSCVCQTLEAETCYATCGYIESCWLFC